MEKKSKTAAPSPPTLKRPLNPPNEFSQYVLDYQKKNQMKKDFVTMGEDALKSWNKSREEAKKAELLEIFKEPSEAKKAKKPKLQDDTYLDEEVIEHDHTEFRKYLKELKKSEYKDLFPEKVRTVKVTNVSLGASQQDIKKFFSFSGEIECVEMKSDTERSQTAYVTFKDSRVAKAAMLVLSGAEIVGMTVRIALEPDYQLPPSATLPMPTEQKAAGGAESTFRKAEDMVSSMLAKGFVLGKNALGRAKSFDEKHQLTSTKPAPQDDKP